jgi:uncharacterized protein YggT (Ycf19 family)
MGRILSKSVIDKISSVQFDPLPDIWGAALASPDEGEMLALRQEWSERAAGGASVLVQQLGVLIDEGVGYAPWQTTALKSLASLPTEHLLSGREIANRIVGLAADLAMSAWGAFKKQIEAAVMELLEPILNLITSIPVIGQIVDLVLGFVFAIVDLIQMHSTRMEEAAEQSLENDRILPAVPSPAADKAIVEQYVKNYANHQGDWSSLFMPYKDFTSKSGYDKYQTWWADRAGGWFCVPIKKNVENPFARGVRIVPGGTGSWGVQSNNFNGGLGLGMVPGTGNIHRDFQVGPSTQVVDTGEWLTMTRNGAMFLWSMLGSDGPSSLTIDTQLITDAWSRYIYGFLQAVDQKKMCRPDPGVFDGVSDAMRLEIRRKFCTTMGLPRDVAIMPAVTGFPGRQAMALLKARQDAVLKTAAVAYVNPSKAPPGLRLRIEDARKSLLESPILCRVDISLIPDQSYKSAVEGKLMFGDGSLCKTGGVQLQAPVKGGERFDERAPKITTLPAFMVPRVAPAGPVQTMVLTGTLPRLTSKPKPETFMEKHGTQVAVGAVTLATAGVAYRLWTMRNSKIRKRKSK